MQEEATRTIEVFYSYAYEDESLRRRLEKHLAILSNEGLITNWYNDKIIPGADKEHEIDTHLNTARIILLLISSDFLASRQCYNIEGTRALERHEAGEACVIPVILRPVDWKNAPFGKLQVLPTNEKPITTWPDRDKAFLDVAIGIREVILGIKRQWRNEENIENHAQNIEGSSPTDDASIALIETQKANTLYEGSRYGDALEEYTQAILLYPEYHLAYRGKGETFQKLKRYDEALVAYEQALQLDPDDINTYRDKGALFYELKRYEEALATYKQILHIDPNDSGASYSKGVVYLRLAQQAFEKAQQLRNSIANRA
jgi:tetratricopeptide (TPR) repeat protein